MYKQLPPKVPFIKSDDATDITSLLTLANELKTVLNLLVKSYNQLLQERLV